MQGSTPSIIRKYLRRSRSPFEGDDSTILLLANFTAEPTGVVLDYQRYIYLHRDSVGRWLGISISNSLEQEMDDGGGKYRQGKGALSVLLSYHDEITNFLRNFSGDVESIFGIDAETWMIACKARWRKLTR
ncbi:hypothetical protein [Alteromonas abrolhosensis]|uniref:hypothetical protein n=1 Tax=Alteromonas abrolhosensis TaxID=1892904 RepID=UPI00096B788F|nr:hypothetical protein [Alteromonas abrolhosensis]|tara:strand:- start:3867 stop:4259 length:393 start_codon:yes stop_codon:yes gene_type:complete